jgi:hypothetical protein
MIGTRRAAGDRTDHRRAPETALTALPAALATDVSTAASLRIE